MRNPAEPDPASQRNTDRCHQLESESLYRRLLVIPFQWDFFQLNILTHFDA